MKLRASEKREFTGETLPSMEESLSEFLTRLYFRGCPRVLVILVYYCMVAFPISSDDLVDSLEVFAGMKEYSKVRRT